MNRAPRFALSTVIAHASYAKKTSGAFYSTFSNTRRLLFSKQQTLNLQQQVVVESPSMQNVVIESPSVQHGVESQSVQNVVESIKATLVGNKQEKQTKSHVYVSKWRKTRQTARDVPKLDPKQLLKYKEVVFTKKALRQSYRKVIPVSNLIIGLNCREALRQLDRCDKYAAKDLHKFLKGCMLNCENTHGMNADRLLIRA